MRRKNIITGSLIAIIVTLIAVEQLFAASIHTEDVGIVQKLSDTTYAEILPRMELLAGVLSQTSWIERRGPRGQGNQYFQALQAFFAQYREHEAIQIAESLTQRGFGYSAPPGFIVHLSSLPELDLAYEYSDELVRRAHGRDILETFRKSLRDLAEQSDFLSFFEQRRSELEGYMSNALEGFQIAPLTQWMDDFYGWSPNEYHIVFAPAMFPGGGYGANVQSDDMLVIYEVIREMGRSEQESEFSRSPVDLAALTFHEFNHSFTNPSLRKYQELIDETDMIDFYTPVQKSMKRQAYGTLLHFLDETLVRSVTALGMLEIYGDEQLYNSIVQSDIVRNFYLVEFTIQQLQYYQDHREQFSRFDEFIPYLLQQYAGRKEDFLSRPMVVTTIPENGTILSVPKEGVEYVFSVTYDQKMRKGFSWCRVTSQEHYPEKIPSEKPLWSNDDKTCTYRMKIYPNRNYTISLNLAGKYESFRSAEGNPAFPYLLQFRTVEEERQS